jgi:hypothetical protein
MTRHALLAPALAFAFSAAVASAVPPAMAPFDRLPVAELKAHYLQCERAASRVVLDAGTAANCSLVYEALLQRAFDGDFAALLAWWRENKLPDDEPAAAAPAPAVFEP